MSEGGGSAEDVTFDGLVRIATGRGSGDTDWAQGLARAMSTYRRGEADGVIHLAVDDVATGQGSDQAVDFWFEAWPGS